MNASEALLDRDRLSAEADLDELESEAIHILREVAGECRNPAFLFSGGKDSAVLLHLARKALQPGRLPGPLLHVDTGHNFPEVIEYRDRFARDLGATLVVCSLEDSVARGRLPPFAPGESRNAAQAVTLREAIRELGFDACLGGARRDEEKARAKERVFSVRDAEGRWNPRAQRPELWSLFNTRIRPGEHLRVFPMANWTELDVWRYIRREQVPLPALYFAHERTVWRRADGMMLAETELTPPPPDAPVERRSVRYRTVGDITCTAPVPSTAATIDAVIAEIIRSRRSERGESRLDDRLNEASMERRKREGYF